MPRRQQRTPAQRRNFPEFAPRQLEGFDWVIQDIDGSDVLLIPQNIYTGTGDTTGDYLVNGVPRMKWLRTGEFAIDAVWQKPYLRVTFPSPLVQNNGIILYGGDMAWRGRFGSFAFQKRIDSPLVLDSSVQSIVATGYGVLVTLGEEGGKNWINGVPDWQCLATLEYPTAARLNGDTLQLDYATPPLAGDEIEIIDASVYMRNNSGGTVHPSLYPVT